MKPNVTPAKWELLAVFTPQNVGTPLKVSTQADLIFSVVAKN